MNEYNTFIANLLVLEDQDITSLFLNCVYSVLPFEGFFTGAFILTLRMLGKLDFKKGITYKISIWQHTAPCTIYSQSYSQWYSMSHIKTCNQWDFLLEYFTWFHCLKTDIKTHSLFPSLQNWTGNCVINALYGYLGITPTKSNTLFLKL